MKRHLSAVARGARMQRKHFQAKVWTPSPSTQEQDAYDYRVHPDDAHLEYGPISKALIAFAVTSQWPYTTAGDLAEVIFRRMSQYPFVLKSELMQARMFALLLAEMLADEMI